MGVLAIIFLITTIVFGIVAIADFIKSRRKMWRYSGVAFKYSLVLTLMSAVVSLWLLWMDRDTDVFALSIAKDILQWPLLFAYISVGIRYARKLKLPGALFWKRLAFHPLSVDEDDERTYTVHDLTTDVGHMVYASSLQPEYLEVQSMQSELSDHLNRKWWMKYDAVVLLCVIMASVYTIVLFNLAQPEVSQVIKNYMNSNSQTAAESTGTVFFVILFARLAAAEEIFFRLAVQSLVEWKMRASKYAAVIAVAFSSLFWSIGHIGVLAPDWVKIAQIFPLGIALGLVYRRYGIEAAILIHVIFNIAMIFLSPGFISL